MTGGYASGTGQPLTPQEILDLQIQRWMEGYDQAVSDMANAWESIPNPGARGRETYAELEKRRWGPAGRSHFGDPRPEDRPGLHIVRGRAA